MNNTITEQPTFTTLSGTAERFVKKIDTREKGSVSSCVFNTIAGALAGFVCSTINPLGPYVGPAVTGGCIATCSTCITLLSTKSVDDRTIVIREKPVNASDSSLDSVETDQ